MGRHYRGKFINFAEIWWKIYKFCGSMGEYAIWLWGWTALEMLAFFSSKSDMSLATTLVLQVFTMLLLRLSTIFSAFSVTSAFEPGAPTRPTFYLRCVPRLGLHV